MLIFFSMFLLPSSSAAANAANPSMEFIFELPGDATSIVNGHLYNCTDAICEKYLPIKGYFSCTRDSCTANLDYLHDKDYVYHKLIIDFTDGTRASNVFSAWAYYAKFSVSLDQSVLVVKEEITPLKMFDTLDFLMYLGVALFNIPVEILVAYIFCRVFKIKGKMISRIVIANLVSLAVIRFIVPLAFFYLALMDVSDFAFILIQEMVAVIIEAIIIIIPGREYQISKHHAVILSIVMNLVSVLLGLLLISIL
jgi:hypothetical protein